jgi:hypothetical protein
MTILSDAHKQAWARILMTLFVAATLLVSVAGSAQAVPAKVCKRHPENFSFFHGKCLSDKRIEVLKERAHHRNHR